MGEFRGLPATGFACLAATLVVMGGPPAAAQTSFEFGYKDRIFKQNYLLPETFTMQEAEAFVAAAAIHLIANPALAQLDKKPEVMRILQGSCAKTFLEAYPAVVEATPEQKAIDAFPNIASSQTKSLAVPCGMQVLAFNIAFMDPASTRSQLDGLAQTIRKRFSDDWFSPAEMGDPRLQEAARRTNALMLRVGRLQVKGMALPESVLALERGSLKSRIMSFADSANYDKMDAELTALERDAPQRLQSRQVDTQRKEKEDAQQAEINRLKAAADERVARAAWLLEDDRSLYEDAAMRARLNPEPNSAAAQAAHSFKVSVESREEDLRSAIAAREKLHAHLAKVTAQSEIGASPDAVLSPPPIAASEHASCAEGQRCRVVEKTIVCMTLDRLQAVLAQPAGAKRRTVLRVLTARGECATLEAGVGVIARGNVHDVTPIGETPVEAITVTLGTGQAGFMLASALGIARQAGQ